jgi:hypothetical protein
VSGRDPAVAEPSRAGGQLVQARAADVATDGGRASAEAAEVVERSFEPAGPLQCHDVDVELGHEVRDDQRVLGDAVDLTDEAEPCRPSDRCAVRRASADHAIGARAAAGYASIAAANSSIVATLGDTVRR